VNFVDPSGMIKALVAWNIINYWILLPASVTLWTIWQYNDYFQTAPWLLFFFTVWNWEDKIFKNWNPITDWVKNSNFYRNSIKDLINSSNNISKITNWEIVVDISANWGSIDWNENWIKEFDLWLWVWKTTANISWYLDKDWYLNTTLIITDIYDFHDDPNLWFWNQLWLLPQKSWAWKPFKYTIEIKDRFIINK